MRRNAFVLSCAIILGAAIAAAPLAVPQEETAPPAAGTLTLSQAVIARGVQDREPVGVATSFPADIGQVYCYTRVEGATGETVIYHAWRQGDKLHAKVQLPVRGSPWRTWSSKRILPAWTGTWTVDIEDADGNILKTLTFTIGGAAAGTAADG